MHDLGKQNFYFSVEIADLKKDLFFLVVNINRISFSNYENPVNISIFIDSLHNLLTSSEFLIGDLTLENIENKLIQMNTIESLGYFELEANIDDFENSALRSYDHIFFFYKVPNHPFYTSTSTPLLQVGEGYANIVPIESVQYALNALIQYKNNCLKTISLE